MSESSWYDVTREMVRLRQAGTLNASFAQKAQTIIQGLDQGHRIIFSPDHDAHYVSFEIDEILFDPTIQEYCAVRRL